MEIRKAKVTDAGAIHALIEYYAQLDRMLFRSLASIYENLQTFSIAELNNQIVGCCALQVIWNDLAEIKSLAVDVGHRQKGVGKSLIKAALAEACALGLKRVFALTMEPEFFENLGFKVIDKKTLPMKVWSDCARCPKQDHCDETAVIIELS